MTNTKKINRVHRRAIVGFGVVLPLLMISYQNCSKIQASDMNQIASLETAGDNDLPPSGDLPGEGAGSVICDPLGGEGSGNLRQGLKGELFYLTSEMPHYGAVGDYIQHGVRSEQSLYLSEVNVPTVRFTHGFATQDGEKVRTNEGEILTEYFALKLKSVLKLPQGMSAGDYQLALLSDDGARVYVVDGNGNRRRVVNNDGTHSTRMGCALNENEKITLDESSRMTIEVEYYQGPRDEIALMLMWRPWQPDSGHHDYSCGDAGSNTYFDWSVFPSVPKQRFLTLQDKGWRTIPPEAFELADDETNPCNME